MEITFCDRCDASIPPAEMDGARRRDGVVICARCLARERRVRIGLVVLAPLCLVAAGALGAVVAILVNEPRIASLESRVRQVEAAAAAPSEPDASVLAEMRGIREVDREQTGALGDLRETLERVADELSDAVGELTLRFGPIEAEIRGIKEHLVAASATPAPAEGPETAPAGGDEATPDLETWLPLVEDPDPGVRLSALVAVEGSADERVVDAALAALSDPDPSVRAQAARMLGARKEERGVDGLLELLSDGNVLVRAVAGKALAGMAGESFGYDPADPEEVRAKAIEAFRDWAGRR